MEYFENLRRTSNIKDELKKEINEQQKRHLSYQDSQKSLGAIKPENQIIPTVTCPSSDDE